MKVDQKLFDAAVAFLEKRFGKNCNEGAAAIYTDSGKILTSTAPETLNDGSSLCHEVGAYCEAFKLNEKITASICVHQDENGKNLVLTPCGICQERLFLYGGEVSVGVPNPNDPSKWEAKLLKEVQPFYWRNILKE
jgi:cytidine deaminase